MDGAQTAMGSWIWGCHGLSVPTSLMISGLLVLTFYLNNTQEYSRRRRCSNKSAPEQFPKASISVCTGLCLLNAVVCIITQTPILLHTVARPGATRWTSSLLRAQSSSERVRLTHKHRFESHSSSLIQRGLKQRTSLCFSTSQPTIWSVSDINLSQDTGYRVLHLKNNPIRSSFFFTASHIFQSVLARKAVMHHRPDSRPGMENAVHSLLPTAHTQSHARKSVGGFHDLLYGDCRDVDGDCSSWSAAGGALPWPL